MRFLISWDSHENLTRFLLSHEIFSNYMDNCARKFTRINLMSFCYFLMRKRPKSHVKIYENLMRTSWKVSWEPHEKSHEKLMKQPKSHEKTSKKSRENQNLMRFSWDLMESSWKSHENFCFFFFSHENLMRFSWEFAKPHENFCKGCGRWQGRVSSGISAQTRCSETNMSVVFVMNSFENIFFSSVDKLLRSVLRQVEQTRLPVCKPRYWQI